MGIIDWTDAALADPVLDFVVLVTWRGLEFAQEVRRSYALPLDEEFEQRLSFTARVQSLVYLAEAIEQGADVAKHSRWMRNAFSSPDPL